VYFFFQYTYFFIPVQVDIRHLLHFFKAKIRPFSLKYLSDTSECPDFLIMQITSSVTVHFVLSNVAKIHSKLPAAMEFWLVCLGILAYSCQNTSLDNGMCTVTIIHLFIFMKADI